VLWIVITKRINQDEQSGIRKKWESMYLKLRKAAQQDDRDNDKDDEEEFVMNPNLLCAEVWGGAWDRNGVQLRVDQCLV